jgi:hypothetical protein
VLARAILRNVAHGNSAYFQEHMEQFITSYESLEDNDIHRAFENFMTEEKDDTGKLADSFSKLTTKWPREESDDASYYTASYITNIRVRTQLYSSKNQQTEA